MTISQLPPERLTLVRDVVARKGDVRISVCLPCRNEADSVGSVVDALLREPDSSALIDELIVIDDGSTDGSAEVAAAAGATVVPIAEIHERYGAGRGKGNVLWSSLLASTGDLIVWIDADVRTVDLSWVAGLVEPLLDDEGIALVKADYSRPQDDGGGGRTTELVIRPLLSLFAPDLAWLSQPLAGEAAVRRSMIETIPFVQGWGVEIAMILDVVASFGPKAVAQTNLGVRRHRHHDLLDLRVQATEVMATFLNRQKLEADTMQSDFLAPDGTVTPLNLAERPPVVSERNT